MSLAEYKAFGNTVPVKDYLLRRRFGSWNRVLSVMQHRYPLDTPAPAPATAPAPKKAAPKAKAKKGK